MSASEDTEKMERVLESAAREFAKHSGPQSDERERATFFRDLRTAALRFARAYYAEAPELGLIPEYEAAKCPSRWGKHKCDRLAGHDSAHATVIDGRLSAWQHASIGEASPGDARWALTHDGNGWLQCRIQDGIHGVWRGNIEGGCENCGRGYALHGSEDRCPP